MSVEPFDARLFSLLSSAMELPADEVDAYLAHACGGDAALVERVRALLAMSALSVSRPRERSAFLARLQQALRAPSASGRAEADLASVEDLLIVLRERPHAIDRYEFRGEIGRGGMGIVHRVWDRVLHRELALKCLRAPDADELRSGSGSTPALLRFLREAHVTAQLDHPGIVSVHDLGITRSGDVFFTMDLVRGRRFDAVLAESGALRDQVAILHKATQAIAYAHGQRVVHRDVSPRNIVAGDHGAVFVLDWGVAHSAGTLLGPADASHDGTSDDDMRHSGSGSILGTLCYAAPEQLRGESTKPHARADVYSCGAVLYHLLRGRPPYVIEGERPTVAQLRARIVASAPEPLARAAPRAPRELVSIAQKAMARAPSERYADAAALAADLHAWLEHREVSAHASGLAYRTAKWIQRRPALAGTIAASIVVVLAVALASIAMLARSNVRIREEQVVAERTLGFLEWMFNSANPTQIYGSNPRVSELLQAGADQLPHADLPPAARARLESSFGSAFLGLSLFESAAPLVERSDEWTSTNLDARDPRALECKELLARVRREQGRFEESAELYSRVLALREESLGPDHHDTIRSLTFVAVTLRDHGQLAACERMYRDAVQRATRSLGPNDFLTLECRRDLATFLISRGRLGEAEMILIDVLPRLESVLGPDHFEVGLARHAYASLLGRESRLHEQEYELVRVVERLRTKFGAISPQTAAVENDLAICYFDLGRFDEALAIQTRLVEYARTQFGETAENTLAAQNNLARTYTNLGRFAEADALFAAVYAGRCHRFGEGSLAVAETLLNWGVNSAKSGGRASEAEARFREAFAIYEECADRLNPTAITTVQSLAAHLRNERRYDESEPLFLDALARRREVCGDHHIETWKTTSGLIRLYDEWGRRERACELARELVAWTEGNDEQHTVALQKLDTLSCR